VIWVQNNVALIGRGYWGRILHKYIPEFFDLRYVVGSDFDLNQIWDDASITTVFIATPPTTHYSLVKQSLLSDKNVFVAKPLSLRIGQARELKRLAKERNKTLFVDYTQRFSPTILKAKQYTDILGEINYIDMMTTQLSKLKEVDVYWTLASHHLSILDYFVPIKNIRTLTFYDYVRDGSMCVTGSLLFDQGRIFVSTRYHKKQFKFTVYGNSYALTCDLFKEPTFEFVEYRTGLKYADGVSLVKTINKANFDERNNVRRSISAFVDNMKNDDLSNLNMAIEVTRLLCRRTYKGMKS